MKTMNVLIKGVTHPGSVRKIANDRGLSVEDVFVRVIFEYNGEDYSASQKVKYLSSKDYARLLKAEENNETLTLDINLEKGFFNIHVDEVSVDELYKATSRTTNVKSLTDLI